MAKREAKYNLDYISNDPKVNPQDIISNSEMPLNNAWAAQFVTWAFLNRGTNIYTEKLAKYRGIDLGVADEAEIRKFFEPNPNIPDKEKADLMRTDWRICPLIHSLNLIIQN